MGQQLTWVFLEMETPEEKNPVIVLKLLYGALDCVVNSTSLSREEFSRPLKTACVYATGLLNRFASDTRKSSGINILYQGHFCKATSPYPSQDTVAHDNFTLMSNKKELPVIDTELTKTEVSIFLLLTRAAVVYESFPALLQEQMCGL
ncbi:hypothetical protein STEG23_008714 [Scotinomys teguina]